MNFLNGAVYVSANLGRRRKRRISDSILAWSISRRNHSNGATMQQPKTGRMGLGTIGGHTVLWVDEGVFLLDLLARQI
jgi:hypothetical protein